MLIKRDIESLLKFGHKFHALDKSELVIFGGTGFVGLWILQALELYKNHFGIRPNVTVYTRNRDKAYKLLIEEMKLSLTIKEKDFTKGLALLQKTDFIISGSTPSRINTGLDEPHNVYSATVNSTKSVLFSAKGNDYIPKVINLSSGIVYGSQSLLQDKQKEAPRKEKNDFTYGYKNAKITAEELVEIGSQEGIIKGISPRLFAFFGPGIELNEHFAIGNFLRDGLNYSKIRINGNPNTIRSYMYPTDLVNWLFSALVNPLNENVNVGSEIPITMFDLANLISSLTCRLGMQIIENEGNVSNYVPSTANFRNLYGVSETVSLEEGLDRWIEWQKFRK